MTRQMLFLLTKDQILRMRRKKISSQIPKKNLTLLKLSILEQSQLKMIRDQLAQLKYQKKSLFQKKTKTELPCRLIHSTKIQLAALNQTQKAKKTNERAVILIRTIKPVGELPFSSK